MKFRLPGGADVGAGLCLALFGCVGAWLATNLRMGTAISMGPGYFPLIIHSGIIILGLVIAARGLNKHSEPAPRPVWRPILVITAALVAFQVLVESAGFVVAAAVLMMVAIKAQDRLNWRQAAGLTAAVVTLASLLFVVALKLPFRLWPV